MKRKTTDKTRQVSEGRRLAVLAALVAGNTREGAARLAGISTRTVDRITADLAFKADLAAARRRAFDEALSTLKGLTARAVETLAELLNSKHEAERRHAAVDLLGFAMKAHEAGEIEARLEHLENILKTAGGRHVNPGFLQSS